MNKKYNWGILGCGKIASKFCTDLKLLDQANLYAVSSRDIGKAQNFAKDFGFEKAYGSYEELASDPTVDIIYIATPHSFHFQHTMLCLENKKAVLCEKAIAINSKELSEMIKLAQKNQTFLMEAFWTQFQPSFTEAMKILKSGELGDVKMLRSDFAFNGPKDPNNRLYNIKLGGGSLLDIGIYPVFASLMAFGKPSEIKTFTNFSFTGSEETISMIFKYPGGEMANLSSSFSCYSSIQTEYWCENGYLRLNKRWHHSNKLSIWKEGDVNETSVEFENMEGAGYFFEAAHVMECLDAGLTESPQMPLSLSADLMEVLDRIREDAGISFPNHD